jgi:lipopolysaccharide/colanic/teichoic acid biosynthesis glycosyltransferase
MLIRFFDIFFSLVAIIVLFPFMLLICIILVLTGEHKVFYLQTRIAKNKGTFQLVKFATMLENSPNLPGGYLTQKNDPRVLPFGRFLRATKINEIPQLLNIIMGQMSIVGPRPMVKNHLTLYKPDVLAQILSQSPGLTGIGSIVFRDEAGVMDKMDGDREENYKNIITPYKCRLELWYIEKKSITMYFTLIFLTAWTVIDPKSRLYARCLKDLPEPPDELRSLI